MDPRLYAVALSGDIESLKRIERQSEAPDLDSVTENDKNTALHLAARAGKAESVKYLLETRPHLCNRLNKKGNTALHECAETGRSVEVARALVDHQQNLLYQRNQNGETALFVASAEGHGDLVEFMLEAANDPSGIECQRTSDGRTCLHAALLGRRLDIAYELLGWRGDAAGKSDNCGATALHLAVSGGHWLIAHILMEVEPRLCYLMDNQQRSPLHIAASRGLIKAAGVILSHRPDCIEVLSQNDTTVLHLAVQNNQPEMLEYLLDRVPGIAEMVNKRDGDGNTALHLATKSKSSQMVKKLLRVANINVNSVNNEGLTPLQIARQRIERGPLAIFVRSGYYSCLQEPAKAASSKGRSHNCTVQRNLTRIAGVFTR